MVKIELFEDLVCWQRARELVKAIYDLSKEGELSRDFKLRDQIRGAAISSMSNIAEGFARFHRKDFIRFLDISQSSCAEVRGLLYIVLDQQYASLETVQDLQSLAGETRKLTLGLLRYVKSSVEAGQDSVREPILRYGRDGELERWELPEEFVDKEGSDDGISAIEEQDCPFVDREHFSTLTR